MRTLHSSIIYEKRVVKHLGFHEVKNKTNMFKRWECSSVAERLTSAHKAPPLICSSGQITMNKQKQVDMLLKGGGEGSVGEAPAVQARGPVRASLVLV